MKPSLVTVSSRVLARRLALSAALVFIAWAGTSAPIPAALPVPDVKDNKSAFIDNRGFGKDPFFPKSRRREAMPTVNPGNANLKGLTLKGVSGTTERRLAIINNYTIAAGEDAEIRAENQVYRFRCLEVRERSVLIQMEGEPEPRAIRLRQGL
jgi:hypothetical protein